MRELPVDVFEALINLFEPLVNFVQALIDLIQALIDLIQALIDLIQTLVDLIQTLVDLIQTLVDLIQALIDSIQTPVDSIQAFHDRLHRPIDQVLHEFAQGADLARPEAFLLQFLDARRHGAARSVLRGSRPRLRLDSHLVPSGAEFKGRSRAALQW